MSESSLPVVASTWRPYNPPKIAHRRTVDKINHTARRACFIDLQLLTLPFDYSIRMPGQKAAITMRLWAALT
jgi:hypothetical protein